MILRNVIVGIAVAALALCLLAATQEPGLWMPALMLAGLVALLLLERNRYQEKMAIPPKERLRPTDERFIDPESGRPVRVWLDPAGKRLYLDEAEGAG